MENHGVSSIDHIFLHPEDILADTERFWKEDAAYRLAKLWHERNNIPIPLDEWRENLKRIVSTPASTRCSNWRPLFPESSCRSVPGTEEKLSRDLAYFTEQN